MYGFLYPANFNLPHVIHTLVKPRIFEHTCRCRQKSCANTLLHIVFLRCICEYVIVCDDDIVILYIYCIIFSKTLTGLSV